MSPSPDLVQSAVRTVASKFEARLGANAVAFLRRVYDKGIAPYEARIRAYGFTGWNRVLDAGCGFGQWSLALSAHNREVHSADVSNDRIDFLRDLIAATHVSNLHARVSRLERLPYEDDSFDIVFCYGVVFLTPWRESVAELIRVLRPGGTLYVNANGFGWYKHLWYHQPNKAADYDPREVVARTFMNTWNYNRGIPALSGGDILIEPDELTQFLTAHACEDVRRGAEGTVTDPRYGGPAPAPFFQPSYMGDLGVYEVLARKRAPA